MRGRKPASITPGTSAVNDVPRAPAWLSRDAKAEWRRVAPILVERRVITEADLGVLEAYCTAIGTIREAQAILKRDGFMLETPHGPKRHPMLGVQNSAMQTSRQCAAELGLTPVSRSRPSIREDDAGEDLSPLDL